jgi:hypothetical protein
MAGSYNLAPCAGSAGILSAGLMFQSAKSRRQDAGPTKRQHISTGYICRNYTDVRNYGMRAKNDRK